MNQGKRQRVLALSDLHISGHGFARLIRKLREEPEILADERAEATIRDELEDAFNDVMEEIGDYKELDISTRNSFKWEFANPLKVLQFFLSHCPLLVTLFRTQLGKFSNCVTHPWRIIFYHDEWVPGNTQRTDNRRKADAIYFSFLELGAALC